MGNSFLSFSLSVYEISPSFGQLREILEKVKLNWSVWEERELIFKAAIFLTHDCGISFLYPVLCVPILTEILFSGQLLCNTQCVSHMCLRYLVLNS